MQSFSSTENVNENLEDGREEERKMIGKYREILDVEGKIAVLLSTSPYPRPPSPEKRCTGTMTLLRAGRAGKILARILRRMILPFPRTMMPLKN